MRRNSQAVIDADCGVAEPPKAVLKMLFAGFFPAWGVAEDPQRGAGARGGENEGGGPPIKVWKQAPPSSSLFIEKGGFF
jgi:hypothetical protein